MTRKPDVDAELERIRRERKAREADSGSGKGKGKGKQLSSGVLPPPTDPMAVARKFVEHCCLHNGAAGELTLRCWQGGWWEWRTTHWMEIEERKVRALLYAFTEHALYDAGKGGLAPWLPTRRKIGDLLEALSVPLLLSNEFEQPCWLDHRDIAGPVVATTNGLLDISTQDAASALADVL